MLFCFLVQNFAEIGQSVDELWPKKRFSRWRQPILVFAPRSMAHVERCKRRPENIDTNLNTNTNLNRLHDNSQLSCNYYDSSSSHHAVGVEQPIEGLKM